MDTTQSLQHPYKVVLKNTNYLWYLSGQLISRFGDSLDAIAYAYMVYTLTGSAALMTFLFGVNAIPTILFQPVAGVLVSRFEKKRVLFFTNIGRGILVSLTVALYASATLQVWHLFVITLLNSTLESFQGPASLAAMPLLLSKEEYAPALGVRSSLGQLLELLGVGCAGFLIGIVGVGGVMLLDALSFFACGVMQNITRYRAEERIKEAFDRSAFANSFVEGVRYMRHSSIILFLVLFGASFSILLIPFNTLSIPFTQEVLHMDLVGVSFLSASMSVGMLLGSALFPILKTKVKGQVLLVSSGMLFGLIYVSMAWWSLIPTAIQYVALALLPGIAGFSAAFILAVVNVAFLEKVDPAYLSRVGGIFNSFAMAAMPLGSLLVGALCLRLSIVQLFFWFGIGVMLLFVGLAFVNVLKEL